MVVFPNCKINLGLRILGKRDDGFHNLETVFYPIPLHDGLEIISSTNNETSCITSGRSIHVQSDDNICTKAYYLLKRDFQFLPPIEIHLHKTIPSGAGLGGGSSDGAYTLVLINKKWRLGLTEKQLINYASGLGSDCSFFITNAPRFATGRGEVLEPVATDLATYKIILVHPGVHINTGWAFSQVNPIPTGQSIKEVILQPITCWREGLHNDFEKPVFQAYPEIELIKKELYANGAIYASLSGSGSTVYGVFAKDAPPNFSFPAHYFIKEV